MAYVNHNIWEYRIVPLVNVVVDLLRFGVPSKEAYIASFAVANSKIGSFASGQHCRASGNPISPCFSFLVPFHIASLLHGQLREHQLESLSCIMD